MLQHSHSTHNPGIGSRLGRYCRQTGNCSPNKGDIGPKHLGRIERGEKVPSFELIIALAKELNTSPATFFHFENANADSKFLAQQLQALLTQRDAKQLRKAFRVLQATLEP